MIDWKYPQPLAVVCLAGLFVASGSHAQTYTNIAPAQGIDILVNSDDFGNGVSFYDFDGDGWDDLTFARSNDSIAFYKNVEGTFVRLPAFIPGPGETKHVLWVDYDNNGVLDLFITTYNGSYRLYRNDGFFNFTDVSASSGILQYTSTTYGASWGDYDRDGDLDLYVCKYQLDGDPGIYAYLNKLYRNNGDGTFTDVTMEAGVGDGVKLSFQSVWLDYDQDGWPDLFIINDRLYANSLYRNNGDGTFADVSVEAGIGFAFQDPMSNTVGDFDNDGDLDIFFSNTGIVNKPARLLVNNNDGSFTESTEQYGTDIYDWCWGGVWVDHDNNGFQDLYVASGRPMGPVNANYFLRNLGGTQFEDAVSIFMGNHVAQSFGVARGDLDNNGFYDIAVQGQNPYPPFVWKNSGGPNDHIKITLQGTVSNHFAIGSWIRVYSDGQCQTQYTHCGENFVGQNSQHHIFGLGTNGTIDSVQVEYVSGHTDSYYDLAINQAHLLIEGETYLATITILGDTVFCLGGEVLLDAGEHHSYLWNNGHTERFLTVTTSGTYSVTVQNEFGVQAQSQQVTVVVHPQPFIVPDLTQPSCNGAADGTIALQNNAGVPPSGVIWDHGATGAEIDGLAAGMYAFIFTDLNGCQASGQVTLEDPAELFVQWAATPEVEGLDATLQLFVFGGVPPYNITLDGIPIGLFTDGLASGQYDLIVTDTNGCSESFPITIDNHTGMTGMVDNGVIIHPNPASGHIVVTGMSHPLTMFIVDIGGKLLLHRVLNADGPQDVSWLPPGRYQLWFVGDNATAFTHSLVIVH